MSELKSEPHGRTFLAGKIIFNFGQSVLDCIVRRISDEGATIELESGLGIPEHFRLAITGEGEPRPCRRIWRSDNELGLSFGAAGDKGDRRQHHVPAEHHGADSLVRNQMLALRAALDLVPVGIVLLDSSLKSQFINHACRQMWALPDAAADRHPSFTALMHHCRDINAYAIDASKLDCYIAERVRLIRDGDPTPIDLRRTNGEVVRMQCTPLPDGSRMLSYTDVTDIVRYADELKVLKDAFENVQDGIVLLDADLNARFLNRSIRNFWEITEDEAAQHPSFASLIAGKRRAVPPDLAPQDAEAFFASRVADVKAGDHVRDLQTPDGRSIRAHCTTLVDGGRMLTYVDVSDLIRNAEQLERLATTDELTGLYNRRHFLASAASEWSRFKRYAHPLSVLMVDIDHFKQVNDRYGHAVGDEAISEVGKACLDGERRSDIVGRLGGEEFAILLPETNLAYAETVAERIRKKIAARPIATSNATFKVTASIGVAEASAGMPALDALMKAADQALYQAKAQGRNRVVCWSAPKPTDIAVA